MGLFVATCFALALWVVLWALEFKPFDGLMIAMAIVLGAASARMLAPYLPGNQPED